MIAAPRRGSTADRMLAALYERRHGPPLSRWELAEAVWPDPEHQPDSAINALWVAMCRCRPWLRSVGCEIEARHGVGFRLVRLPPDEIGADAPQQVARCGAG